MVLKNYAEKGDDAQFQVAIKYIFIDLYQNKKGIITKPCTHLHPAPSSSTHLQLPPPRSIHLHPAHLSLHPALWTPWMLLEPKYCT